MKILHFTWHCINRFLYSHLVCCCIVNCDLQEFLCTVTCIKNLLLSNLNDKPQLHLTLNHIESNCYQPYNHLPDNGRPFVACQHLVYSSFSSKPKPFLWQSYWQLIAGLECHVSQVRLKSQKFRGKVSI